MSTFAALRKELNFKSKPIRNNLILSFLIMVGGTFVFYWVPILGPMLAGFLGGLKSGSTFRSILAGIPATILIIISTKLFFSDFMPGFVVSFLQNSDPLIIMLMSFPLIFGIIMGGALGEN